MKYLIPLLVLSFSAHAQQSYIPFAKPIEHKGYQLSLSGNYWSSAKRIDLDGNKTDFPDGESFSRIESEFSGILGVAKNFQIGGGAKFRQNQMKVSDGSGNIVDATSSGPESLFVNGLFAFDPVNRIQFGIEGAYRYRPYTDKEINLTNYNREDIMHGEQGNEYSIGLAASYTSVTKNYLSLRGGFRDPGTDVSNEIYYQAEAALAWKHIALVAGVDGVYSMKDDPYTDDPASKPAFNRGNSELYNGINREYMAPYVGLNIALGKSWRAEFRGSQVIAGRSTDTGTQFGVTLAYRKETAPDQLLDSKFKTYDIEATVTKVSQQKNFVEIDKGLSSDVYKGMRVDLFEFDYLGGNVLVARGVVMQVRVDSAVIKISTRFNPKKEITKGLIARMSSK
jgi:hypothetical protein